MSERTILAIDNGTQSVRALLFDLHGNIVAKSQVHLDAYFSEHPGWAEHDPKATGRRYARPARACGRSPASPRPASKGVAVTTQRGTVINLDAQGKPLRPAIIWLDQRRTDQLPPVGPWWGAAFQLARRAAAPSTTSAARPRSTGSARPARHLGRDRQVPAAVGLSELPPVRALRRLGRLAGGLRAVRLQAHRWAGKRDWKWQALPIKPSMLPELVAPGTVIGDIDAAAAARTGIPRGHAADGRRRRQGLRSDRRRLPRAAHRLPELRHHRHHQHHRQAVHRGDALHSAVPGGDAGRLQHRDADLPRLLDGELVQGAVRPARAGARAGTRASRRRSCSTSW